MVLFLGFDDAPGVVHLAGAGARTRGRKDDRKGPGRGVLGGATKLSPLPLLDDGSRENGECTRGQNASHKLALQKMPRAQT